MSELLHINWNLFEAINAGAGHQPLLDKVMKFGANDMILIVPLLLLALWFGLAFWAAPTSVVASSSSEAARGLRAAGERLALLACLAVVVALGINLTLGHLIYEPRPFVSDPDAVHKLISHAADASFPSDHEAVISSVVTVLIIYALLALARSAKVAPAQRGNPAAMQALRRERALAVTLAVVGVIAMLFIGVARVYVGVHYPGDIAGGAVCGLIGGGFASALRRVAEPALGPLVRIARRLRLA